MPNGMGDFRAGLSALRTFVYSAQSGVKVITGSTGLAVVRMV